MTPEKLALLRSTLQIAINTAYTALVEVNELKGTSEEEINILEKSREIALEQIDDIFGL